MSKQPTKFKAVAQPIGSKDNPSYCFMIPKYLINSGIIIPLEERDIEVR